MSNLEEASVSNPQTMLPLFDKCMKDDGGGDIVYNVNEKKSQESVLIGFKTRRLLLANYQTLWVAPL